jgi:hypothetical protein
LDRIGHLGRHVGMTRWAPPRPPRTPDEVGCQRGESTLLRGRVDDLIVTSV